MISRPTKQISHRSPTKVPSSCHLGRSVFFFFYSPPYQTPGKASFIILLRCLLAPFFSFFREEWPVISLMKKERAIVHKQMSDLVKLPSLSLQDVESPVESKVSLHFVVVKCVGKTYRQAVSEVLDPLGTGARRIRRRRRFHSI